MAQIAATPKKQPAPPSYSSAGSPLPATANPLPLPVGEGKTRRRSEQKFVPPEEALALTLPHGRGDGFAANPKKQPAP
ncbi:hypothetical protein [Kingella denitrificans]|uniref:hypothetical protein n=1 Tax=Kingella denitrificans TaxID=502 RepID=UPI0028D5694B|nr:hypothetical protein [Kingella denitrificans]